MSPNSKVAETQSNQNHSKMAQQHHHDTPSQQHFPRTDLCIYVHFGALGTLSCIVFVHK
jgi:hypothetical protein